jgi:hypothetical protein
MTLAITTTLEGVERQLAALSEMVADMKRGQSFARLGNLAHDAELACFDLGALFAAVSIHAANGMCAEQDAARKNIRRVA